MVEEIRIEADYPRKLVKTNKRLADPAIFSGRNRGWIAIRNSANGAVRVFEQKM